MRGKDWEKLIKYMTYLHGATSIYLFQQVTKTSSWNNTLKKYDILKWIHKIVNAPL